MYIQTHASGYVTSGSMCTVRLEWRGPGLAGLEEAGEGFENPKKEWSSGEGSIEALERD